MFVLGPEAAAGEKWFANTFSFIPFLGGGGSSITPGNYFIAGLILAIMILPIVSAISREVLATVPAENKEAALALGATRWEMIRISVLPYARPGITGGAMLGLGRAIGETIAVVLVIGNAPTIGHHIFDQGYSLAAVIANEFGEAANEPLHSSALFAAGLVLFVLTLLVNIVARWFVARAEPGQVAGPAAATTARAAAATVAADDDHGRPPVPASPDQRPPPAHRQGDAGGAARRDEIALIPLVLIIYYLLYKGLKAWSGSFFTTRSERQLLRQPRRGPQRDRRHARDRRTGDADLCPDRDLRRAVPDRVRQGPTGSRTSCGTSSM